MGKENLALTGIRSPDRPDRNKFIYQLRHPGHYTEIYVRKFLEIVFKPT